MDWAIFKDESDLGKCPSGCVKFPPPIEPAGFVKVQWHGEL